MLKLLKPREDVFFELLRDMAGHAYDSGHYLKTFIDSTDDIEMDKAHAALEDCRAKAKATSVEITNRLYQTFITPLDREDIEDLASALYKIPKKIEKVHARISQHHMRHSDFTKQANLIVKEAEAMKALVEELTSKRGRGQVMKQVAVLRDLEHEGDRILSELMGKLFAEENDIKSLILHKDLYDVLEKVIDYYRDVASIAVQIVLKHN